MAVTSVGSVGTALLSPGVAAVVLVGWAALISGGAARFTVTREAH